MISVLMLLTGLEIYSHKSIEVDLTKPKQATVISFLSAKCPCSASHETKLKELNTEFQKDGFEFVAVHSNIDEEDTLTLNHFKESVLNFPIIQDRNSEIANSFGALKTPHVFIVNPKGKILYQGGVDDSHQANLAKNNYLRDALIAIKAGKIPEINETRTLGCVIKRR